MLDMNGKDNRVNRQTIPSIPPGYLLASVTYDTDRYAVFLAFNHPAQCWVVGEWDAREPQTFFDRLDQFRKIAAYPANEAGFGDACMDFATRSNPLLKTYTEVKRGSDNGD